MQSQEINIWLLDDHPLVLQAIRAIILQDIPRAQVSNFTNIKSLLIHARNHSKPHLVILDWHLPDGSALQVLEKFDAELALLPIQPASIAMQFLILSAGEPASIEASVQSLQILRPQVIYKNQTMHIFSGMIRKLLQGEVAHSVHLTPRQINMMELLELGLKNSEIADSLCISEYTVKAHVADIFKKLNVQSRTQAVHRWKMLAHNWSSASVRVRP